MSLKTIYHRAVPASLRNPVGMIRRRIADRVRRMREPLPVPHPELLARVQMTPWAAEYLEMGRRSASAILDAFSAGGIPADRAAAVLDFGCGSGRTIRHLRKTAWSLTGSDTDSAAIAWSMQAFPFARFIVNAPDPPLPFEDGSFDAVYAISVFTHFPEARQIAWRDELVRILRPGGLLLLSTMGPSVVANFPRHATTANLHRLDESGFVFIPGTAGFNSSAAFHTTAGINRLFSSHLHLRSWLENGLDGFQDVVLLQRPTDR